MSQSLAKSCNATFDINSHDPDWLWFALVCLWERWLPDRPSFELIDDQMQAGYEASVEGNDVEACRIWSKVWQALLSIIDEQQMGSVDELDDRFGGTQSVFNWLSDFEMALGNAAVKDLAFAEQRVSFCRAVIERFSDDDTLRIQNCKRALADSMRRLGDAAGADALYSQWLRDDPQWGWGWIGWSDDHYLFAPGEQADGDRALQILRQGLTVSGVRDRRYMLERLADLCEDLGRTVDAQAALVELRELDQQRSPPSQADDARRYPAWRSDVTGAQSFIDGEDDDAADSSQSVDGLGRRVGRNELCPCGSGKKYKKCCLSRTH
jgi:hypothetical protein